MAADNPEDKAGMFHLPLAYLEQCDKTQEVAKRGIKEVKFMLEEYGGYPRHAMLNFIGELLAPVVITERETLWLCCF